MKRGSNITGRPSSLFPNLNKGLFLLANNQDVVQEAVSICRIVAIRITSATYNNEIIYLPVPTPTPEGCDADCEAAIRTYLPIGTENVKIKAGGQTVGQGTIAKSEYGMLVLVGPNNTTPTFVSTCKAEILTT